MIDQSVNGKLRILQRRVGKCFTQGIMVLILVFLLPLVSSVVAQPIITVNHHTIPDNPSTGEFILSIDLSNTGGDARNLKLHIFEGEKDLAIMSGKKEVSSIFLTLGDLSTGSTAAQVKLKAEEPGFYELHAKISYVYGDYAFEGSVNKVIAVKVLDGPEFSISGELSIEPATTENFEIEIMNSGGKARNVGISLSTPDDIVSNLGKIVFDEWDSGEKKTISFTLTVDSSAEAGVYELDIVIEYSNEFGEKSSETIPVAIKVIGIPKLSISGTSTTPDRILPENEFSISIIVENSGTDVARNTEIELSFPDYFEGERIKFLGVIERDSSKTAKFNLKALNTTPADNHEFSIKLDYNDIRGKEYSSEYEIPVFVSSPGKISLDIAGVFTSPGIPASGENYKLSLQIENSGSQDAKAVSVKLLLPEDFEGRDTYFIGTLESGDSATASFDLKADKSGNYNLNVLIRYMDSKFEQHEIKRSFTQYISQKNYSAQIAVAIASLIIIGFFGYRMFRKK
jgi:hypothetical protein